MYFIYIYFKRNILKRVDIKIIIFFSFTNIYAKIPSFYAHHITSPYRIFNCDYYEFHDSV